MFVIILKGLGLGVKISYSLKPDLYSISIEIYLLYFRPSPDKIHILFLDLLPSKSWVSLCSCLHSQLSEPLKDLKVVTLDEPPTVKYLPKSFCPFLDSLETLIVYFSRTHCILTLQNVRNVPLTTSLYWCEKLQTKEGI